MKGFLSIILIGATSLVAYAQDNFLLPDEFFLSNGQVLNVHLFVGDDLKNAKEQKYQSSITSKFWFLDGKKNDIKASSSDNLMPVLSRKLNNIGLAMVAMVSNTAEIEVPRERFLDFLNKEGLDELLKITEVQNKDSYKEKIRWYSKTLVMVDKPSGGLFNETMDQPLEIILLQNPYKMKYGDDMTAKILFNKKPLANSKVEVLTKALNGSVFTSSYRTDADGEIYFKLNRAGTWIVRLTHLLPTKDPGFDFEYFGSNYTFGFR